MRAYEWSRICLPALTGKQLCAHCLEPGAARPDDLSISLRKAQHAGTQAIPDPLKHFLGRRGDQHRLAADAIDLFDPLFFLYNPKDVVCPCRVSGQPQKAHQRGPSLLATVSQQDRLPRAPIGVKMLGHRQQMAHRMFPARQSHCPFIAGGMFAEGQVFCCAVGEGQTEGGLLVNGRRDCANIRVISEDAQKMCLPVFPYIAIDPQANAGTQALAA